ncbi:uncharacterized protein MONOS_12937 [Monocercomonoides exilis]|uniref:uncharacterized protein n=1 Tax=Monocercomonoides exilis TaxID=2049356 RepID=UPI00355A2486|nr:hypothetical protein MONOS_12937 [Monocercomonoides exilis]|eukprot:MONOS_12937.1-p1 / transcript=MONOS_12937.1 / gene=MONOS_12937 / organism=Monocercomonoides_exilis_PA203 / gene_product=unspecified product / transcript_product=unspecified product / location=Mono_scaffold00756:3638-7219(-) / protein_length=1194 / sequence_SO=supercontig / SO=protein_coding / is_pseudo=false
MLDENGEKFDIDDWRRYVMRQQDFSAFTVEALRNRYMQLHEISQKNEAQRQQLLAKKLGEQSSKKQDTPSITFSPNRLYDIGYVQRIFLDLRCQITDVNEQLAEEGERINLEKGELDGTDDHFSRIKLQSEVSGEEDWEYKWVTLEELEDEALGAGSFGPLSSNPSKSEWINADEAGDEQMAAVEVIVEEEVEKWVPCEAGEKGAEEDPSGRGAVAVAAILPKPNKEAKKWRKKIREKRKVKKWEILPYAQHPEGNPVRLRKRKKPKKKKEFQPLSEVGKQLLLLEQWLRGVEDEEGYIIVEDVLIDVIEALDKQRRDWLEKMGKGRNQGLSVVDEHKRRQKAEEEAAAAAKRAREDPITANELEIEVEADFVPTNFERMEQHKEEEEKKRGKVEETKEKLEGDEAKGQTENEKQGGKEDEQKGEGKEGDTAEKERGAKEQQDAQENENKDKDAQQTQKTIQQSQAKEGQAEEQEGYMPVKHEEDDEFGVLDIDVQTKGEGDYEALDAALIDLQPFFAAEEAGEKALITDANQVNLSETAKNRAQTDAVAGLFHELRDLMDEKAEELKEKPMLVAANLVEVDLMKGAEPTTRKILAARHKDPLGYLTNASKTKGLKAVDDIIRSVVDRLKNALKAGEEKAIINANMRLMMLFFNRSAVCKVRIMADEELIYLLLNQLLNKSEGKLQELMNTLAMLSRMKENHEAFIKHGVITALAPYFTKELKGLSIVLGFSEMICFLSSTPQCRAIILEQDIMDSVVQRMESMAHIDIFTVRYLTGFLYQLSTSEADLQHILKVRGEKVLISQLRKYPFEDDDLIRLTTGALVHLTNHSTVCKTLVVRSAVPDLFRIASDYKDGFYVIVRNALSILCNCLDTLDGRLAVGREAITAIPLLVRLVDIHHDVDEAVVTRSCSILHFYASQTMDYLPLLYKVNVLAVVAGIITDYKKFPLDTLTSAVGVLASMCLHHKQTRVDLETSDVVPLLGFLLSSYCETNPDFTQQLLGAVFGLSFIPKNRKVIGGLNAVSSILKALDAHHRTHPVIVRYGTGALAQLVSTPPFHAHFLAGDGLVILDEVLMFYLDSTEELWPVVRSSDDHRGNAFRGDKDLEEIRVHLTATLVGSVASMNDSQKERCRGLNIMDSLTRLITQSVGYSEAVCQNVALVIKCIYEHDSLPSAFQKQLRRAREQYPNSKIFEE